jgi:hypothetical protein
MPVLAERADNVVATVSFRVAIERRSELVVVEAISVRERTVVVIHGSP